MSRPNRVWFRKDIGWWMVTVGGNKVRLTEGRGNYLTKPFGVGELLARVRVGMRHASTVNQETGDTVFSVGGLRIDLANRNITLDGKPVHLTPNEFRFLSALVKHHGKVLTHTQLLKEVWGTDSTEESHYVRIYMDQLRQKLEADPSRPLYLLTETGVGYRLACEVDVPTRHIVGIKRQREMIWPRVHLQ